MPRKTNKPVVEEKVFKCKDCEYTTHRKAFMQDHVRIHTGERPFKCTQCGKGFTQKSNLTKHLIVHGGGYKTEYQCDRCDFKTMYKQSLKMHMNWHEGVKPYKCDLCDREFSQSTHRRTHMKEAHGDERKFQCHLCSKCFKRKEHLDKHLVFHGNERNFDCDICGKKFFEAKHVTIHMLVHTGDETKVHQCDLCDYKSRYKQGLQVHYRIHLGMRPYKCKECPKAFRTSQTLRIHSRMVHQGMMGKIFSCGDCEYSTANKQTLRQHIDRIHMGIQTKKTKLTCEYCKKIYATKSSLHGHKRKKHPIKLRQELQAKLQQRLDKIKRVDNPEKSSLAGTIDDYRYRSTIHNAITKAMATAVKKSIKESPKSSPVSPKQQSQLKKSPRFISPKKEVVTPKKSPASSAKARTGAKSPRRIRLSDILNKNSGRTVITRRNLAKELHLEEEIPSSIQEKDTSENQSTEVTHKLSYMSHLGLLYNSLSQDEDVQNDSSQRVEGSENGSSKLIELSGNSKGTKGATKIENVTQDQTSQVNWVVIGNHLVESATPECPKKTKSRVSTKSSGNKRQAACLKKVKLSFQACKVNTQNDSQAQNVTAKASPKSPTRKNTTAASKKKSNADVIRKHDDKIQGSPKNTSRAKRGKSITQIADSLVAKKCNVIGETAETPVVEYEPLALPSLGPWGEESYEPLDLSLQTLGSVTGNVPGFNSRDNNVVAEGAVCVKGEVISPLKTYDSLRDLACMYMNE